MVESNLKPRSYTLKEVCRVIDQKQKTLYIKHGVYPIDMYASKDFDTGKDITVYVFLREDTKELYDLWLKHKLQ